MYCIASVSWGKDSLAMLILLIQKRMPLNEVVFYDTGMEFNAIYNIRDKMIPYLKSCGIKYTELKPKYGFTWQMLERPVNGRNGLHYGYSWCGGPCRWGTTDKIRTLDKYAEERQAIVYIALAADECKRLQKKRKPYKKFPLVDLGITESMALELCYSSGFYWQEDDVYLYDIFSRVSCWCCANKNLRELENMYLRLPEYWKQLEQLQSRTNRPMKGNGKSVFQLSNKFKSH